MEGVERKRTFLINLMSSPGGGKTTTLKRTIRALQDEMQIGVMEADIDSAVDADAISETGAKVIQLHTGGMCHLDADMTRQGLEELEPTTWIWPSWKMWAIWYARRNLTPAR